MSSLLEWLLIRADQAQPVTISVEQGKQWPTAEFDWWVNAGVLVPASPLEEMTCRNCPEQPIERIVWIAGRDTPAPTPYLPCPICGPIQLLEGQLRRWQLEPVQLWTVIFAAAGASVHIREIVAGQLWKAGHLELPTFDPPPNCECHTGGPIEAVVVLPPQDQDCCSACCCPDPMPDELVLTFVGYGPDSCSGGSGGGDCDGLIGQEVSLSKVGIRIWEGTESLVCEPYGSVSLFVRLRCIPEVCPPGTGVPTWELHIAALGGSCPNPQQMGFTDYSQPGQDPITSGAVCCPFFAEYRVMVQGTSEVPPDPTCCCIANTTCDILVEITDPNPPDPCP